MTHPGVARIGITLLPLRGSYLFQERPFTASRSSVLMSAERSNVALANEAPEPRRVMEAT
jgi:hypothetical protein